MKRQPEKNMSEEKNTTEAALDELRDLMRGVEELLNSSTEAVDESVKKKREKLNDALDSAKASALQAKAATGARAADKVIREHPYEAVGIAFGVGLLIGVLINRK